MLQCAKIFKTPISISLEIFVGFYQIFETFEFSLFIFLFVYNFTTKFIGRAALRGRIKSLGKFCVFMDVQSGWLGQNPCPPPPPPPTHPFIISCSLLFFLHICILLFFLHFCLRLRCVGLKYIFTNIPTFSIERLGLTNIISTFER